jgi:hypothetical protein
MRRTTLILIASLLAYDPASAQSVPPLMNYQGHLTNANGQPLATGQYTLTFNVYNVPTGGATVWGPQAIMADVVDGYFNVVLSTDSTGGDSITTAFIAQPRYVSIRVDAAAEILPRQQVLSAPYAIQANRAAAADVVSPASGPGNIFPSTGFVGIGTTTPDRELSVSGSSQFTGNVDVTGNVTATGALAATTLQFDGQKFCRIGTAGVWTSATIVPNSWTMAQCDNFREIVGGNIYLLGCMFSTGPTTTSIGTQGTGGQPNAGIPQPNCGWQ